MVKKYNPNKIKLYDICLFIPLLYVLTWDYKNIYNNSGYARYKCNKKIVNLKQIFFTFSEISQILKKNFTWKIYDRNFSIFGKYLWCF